MKDIEKLDKLDKLGVRVAVMKNRTISKARFSTEEKEALKNSIADISKGLAEILADETLDVEFKERLENHTRKQMVLISKTLDDLERLIKASRNVVGE